MKLLSKITLMILCGAMPHVKGDETPLPTRPSTPAEMKATRERIEAYRKSQPLEMQPVAYIVVSGKLVPAQIDPNQNIEYRWRGVALDPSQIPRFMWAGSFGVYSMKPTGLEVRQMDPPIRYFAIAGTNRYGAGYYDPSNAILYQWDRVELNRAALPADAEAQGLIIDPSSVEISSVEPPAEFAPKEDAAVRQPSTPSTPARTTTPTALQPPSTPAASGTPVPIVEHKSPVWLWLVGILALVVIVALALKRRA